MAVNDGDIPFLDAFRVLNTNLEAIADYLHNIQDSIASINSLISQSLKEEDEAL